jgi:hypothetical protein
MIDCAGCRRLIDALRAGSLAEPDRARMEAHLDACRDCEAHFAAASRELTGPDAAESERLVRGVLARTTGDACARAHALLPDAVDGRLADGDARLLARHVEHCGDCAELRAALAWVAPLLPGAARLEPGEDFAAAVLAATTGAGREAGRPAWLEALAARWRSLIRRPRFSLEGAYALTLVLIALFGTPLSPAREAPTRALALVQEGPRALVADAPDLRAVGEGVARGAGALWERGGAPVLSAADALGEDLDGRRRRASAPTRRLGGHLAGLGREALATNWPAAGEKAGSAAEDCKDIWRAWTQDAPGESERDDG